MKSSEQPDLAKKIQKTPETQKEQNLPESKEEPRDIYEFFEHFFGHEIFFVEDLMVFDEENKKLLYKFFNIKTTDVDKNVISLRLVKVVRQQPNRIEKFPFNIRSKQITAYRIRSSSDVLIDKKMVTGLFLKKFPNFMNELLISKPLKKPEIKSTKLNEEELVYYEKLKNDVQTKLNELGYFELSDSPANEHRLVIMHRLMSLGLIKLKTGSGRFMDSCTFEFP
jgi:hypothetical protein